MTDLCKTKTFQNLAASFAAECQCGAKYQFIRKEATAQKFFAIAKLMQQNATEEMGHARRIWDVMTEINGGGENSKNPNLPKCDCDKKNKNFVDSADCACYNDVKFTAGFPFRNGSLLEMLSFIADEEEHQHVIVYPAFAKQAEKDGYKDIALMFNQLAEVEHQHNMRDKEIYQKMKTGKLYKSATPVKWMCQYCGYQATAKQAWDTCPLCKEVQGYTGLNLTDMQ